MARPFRLILTAAFGMPGSTTYAFYDINDYDDGSVYAPDNWSALSDLEGYIRYADGVHIQRGVTSISGTTFRASAGTMSLTLDNLDRRFDPLFLIGPYVLGGQTCVRPAVRVSIRPIIGVTTYPAMFTGTVDGWPQTYPSLGHDQVVQLNATDAIGELSSAELQRKLPVQLSGTRIDRVLDDADWNGPRSIATGETEVNVFTQTSVTAWSVLGDTAEAENGDLYCAGDYTLTFRGRKENLTETRSTVSQATFGDGVGELDISDIGIDYDSKQIFNDATIIVDDHGHSVNAQDTTSQAKPWGKHSWNKSLPIHDVGFARTYADWIVQRYGEPVLRFSQITVKPLKADATGLAVGVFNREIGDLITVKLTPKGGGARIIRTCWIRGIADDIVGDDWTTRFVLEDASWISNIAYYDVSDYDDGSKYGL